MPMHFPRAACFLGLLSISSLTAADPAWPSCPVYTPETQELLKAEGCRLLPPNTTTASCALFAVPLSYPKHNKTISQFVKRVFAPTQPSKGFIVLLNGGPGGGGSTMECLIADLFSTTGGAYDIVIPDHRGVGRSSALLCNNETDQLSCLKQAMKLYEPSYLHSFSVTNAAQDIHSIVTALRSQPDVGSAAMLYGVSYGTYLAQRYLQLYPDEMSAVVLDGVCAPDLTRLIYYDYGVNAAGRTVLDLCAQDATCSERLGAPSYAMHLVYELARSGELDTCLSRVNITHATTQETVLFLQDHFGQLVLSWPLRPIVGALLKRLLFCGDDDVTELRRFFHDAAGPDGLLERERRKRLLSSPRWHDVSPAGGLNSLLYNFVLAFNIGTSELGTFAQSPSLSSAVAQDTLLSFAIDPTQKESTLQHQLDKMHHTWPVYTPSAAYYNRYPNTSIPMLLLTGSTDPQTPTNWLLRVSRVYTGSQQYLVSIPSAVHASAWPGRSPVDTAQTQDTSSLDCGMQLAGSFLGTQGDNVQLTCLDNLQAIDFAGQTNATQTLSQQMFGTTSLWGTRSAFKVSHN